MPSKIFVVFGATGQQGSSIVNSVLNDSELSQRYALRAITRDISKPAAQDLAKKGVEIVQGDIQDVESLKRAFSGAWGTFIMSTPAFSAGDKAKETEFNSLKIAADAAVASGIQYIVLSSLPHTSKITSGQLPNIAHFDAKAEAETYMRSLPVQSAFYAPGIFMSNFHTIMALKPSNTEDGAYVFAHIFPPTAELALVHAGGDTGKWIGAILANPEQFNGRFLAAATDVYTIQEIIAALSRSTEKTIRYEQLSDDAYKSALPGFLATAVTEAFTFVRDYGSFGPGTKKAVEEAAALARGRLTTFDEYLIQSPIELQ